MLQNEQDFIRLSLPFAETPDDRKAMMRALAVGVHYLHRGLPPEVIQANMVQAAQQVSVRAAAWVCSPVYGGGLTVAEILLENVGVLCDFHGLKDYVQVMMRSNRIVDTQGVSLRGERQASSLPTL